MALDQVLRNLSANLAAMAIREYLELKLKKTITDLHKDGISKDEFEELTKYMEMLSSIWSLSVYADDEYQEEEEDMVYYFFKYLFVEKDPDEPGRDPLLPIDLLEEQGYDVVELLANLHKRFREPYDLASIIDYAKSHHMERIFYMQALCIITADSVLEESEQKFIDSFAAGLSLYEGERKFLEGEYFKLIK